MTKHVNVLVTAIGGGGHGEQILKALRLAPGNRYRLFGADVNRHCPQFDMVHEGVTLPPARDASFIDSVLSFCEEKDIKAVFHGCEPELIAYSKAASSFAERDILLPINRPETIELCMDKVRSSRFLAELGFAPPRFVLAADYAEASAMDTYPLVVKPHVGSGGSKDCFIVQNDRELQAIITFLTEESNKMVMVQEYVGTPEEEYTVGVLHDLGGEYINAIAVRRELRSALNLRVATVNRTGRSELGQRLVISSGISMGEVCRHPEVLETCRRIARALDARGAINIQGRMTKDGFKVFEINPRFSGTTSIRALMGYNEPDILLRRHLFGETIQTDFEFETGFVLRSLQEYRPKKRDVDPWRAG